MKSTPEDFLSYQRTRSHYLRNIKGFSQPSHINKTKTPSNKKLYLITRIWQRIGLFGVGTRYYVPLFS